MAGKLATEKAAEAFDTIVDFLESFESLDDPRQRGKVLYPLDEVLLLVLLGVIAGCESWVEIARYGEKKLALLRRFRPFEDETPSHDQLGDIFAVLDAEQFQACFVAWVAGLTGLEARHPWAGLTSIVMVESCREIGARTEHETRFYITSIAANAERIGTAIRGHWGIENGLHWVMDMVFRDDECRIRKNNAPANFATVKHMASNLLRQAPGKDSLRVKRKVAAWDDDFLASLIARKQRSPDSPEFHPVANAHGGRLDRIVL